MALVGSIAGNNVKKAIKLLKSGNFLCIKAFYVVDISNLEFSSCWDKFSDLPSPILKFSVDVNRENIIHLLTLIKDPTNLEVAVVDFMDAIPSEEEYYLLNGELVGRWFNELVNLDTSPYLSGDVMNILRSEIQDNNVDIYYEYVVYDNEGNSYKLTFDSNDEAPYEEDELDSDGTGKKEIYLKWEPCGEYSFGKIDEDDVAELKKIYGNDEEFYNSTATFVEVPEEYDSVCHVYGVGVSGECYAEGYTLYQEEEIGIPYDEDGFYLFRSTPTKMSTSFELDVDEETFEPEKLKITYTRLNCDELSDDYGSIEEIDIITNIEYDGKDYTEVMQENIYSDGGYIDTTVVQIVNGDVITIYKTHGDEITWMNEPLDSAE